jgi:hypothetical protein
VTFLGSAIVSTALRDIVRTHWKVGVHRNRPQMLQKDHVQSWVHIAIAYSRSALWAWKSLPARPEQDEPNGNHVLSSSAIQSTDKI